MALSRRKVEVVIYDGDDEARLSELHVEALTRRKAYNDAKASQNLVPRRTGDGADFAALDEQAAAAEKAFDDFVGEAAERAESFVVQAIGRVAFRDLKVAHPPRMVDGPDGSKEMHREDVGYDVDTDSFSRALLMWRDEEDENHRTLLTDMAPSKLGRLLDNDLAEGDFDKLWVTAWALNTEVAVDPKALRFSAPPLPTGASSGQRAGSD